MRALLRPDAYAAHLSNISFDYLAAQNVDGIIVDLDNTLVGYRLMQPGLEDAAWVAKALERGFKVAMVSNNVTAWVTAIAGSLGIPHVPKALKPLPAGFGKALKLLGTAKERTIVVGDQLFTDVLGAKLFGLRVILIDPIVPKEHRTMRFLRLLERLLIKKLRMPKAH